MYKPWAELYDAYVERYLRRQGIADDRFDEFRNFLAARETEFPNMVGAVHVFINERGSR